MSGTVSADAPYPPLSRAWTAAGVLAVATVFAFIDRLLLNILLEPVRQTLGITDTEISLLQGMAFILFYLVFSLPVGWLLDRRNRRNIMILGVLTWSVMTVACGLADDFWTLFAARAGVGIGEAVLAPAAFSIIADYFPQRLRGRAMALIVMSTTMGSGSSFLLAGAVAMVVPGAAQVDLPLLGAVYGWQLTFFAAGLPGLAIAGMLLLVREPPRREGAGAHDEAAAAGVWSYARRNLKILLLLIGAAGLFALASNALVAWMAALYIRHFGLTVAELGFTLGFINILIGLPGGLAGGYLSDWFASRPGRGGRMNVMCLGSLFCILPLFLWPYVGSYAVSLVFLALCQFSFPLIIASIPSTLHAIVPNRLRGRMTAVLYLANGIMGTALGPLVIAAANDNVFVDGGVRQSLMVLLPLVVAVGCAMSFAGRSAYQRARAETGD
ncbi:MAG: MFS transporter [Sphingomonadales bacterium]